MKGLVCCSPGGHLSTAIDICKSLRSADLVFVVHDYPGADETINGWRLLRVMHSDRDIRVFVQFFQAMIILLTEKPDFILSSGASIAVPFLFLGKLLGIKTIYVETASRVHTPSLTGKLVNFCGARVYVRYPNLVRSFRNGVFKG
jgi:UDP-N-acetylglucosamine:LPS N-acetylglucosamine transferase